MKRTKLFGLYTMASVEYHAALNGWRIKSFSGWKKVKASFYDTTFFQIRGKVEPAKRVPDLGLLRDARNAAEAAYLAKQPRPLVVVNTGIAMLSTKASKIDRRRAKGADARRNRLRILVIEDQISLFQKEAGLIPPSTPASLTGSTSKAGSKASKKALRKARKNPTKVSVVAFGNLDPEQVESPRDFDFASYADDVVETAYRYFLAKATKDDDHPERSYWSGRLFARQNPTITSQAHVLDAWKAATKDPAAYYLMDVRSGIKAEFDLRRNIGVRDHGTVAAGAH